MASLVRAIEAGRVPRLSTLYLGYNRIHDAGALALAQIAMAGQLSRIERLSLDRNQISSIGAKALAQAVKSGHMPKLYELWLQENSLNVDSTVLDSLIPSKIAEAILDGIALPFARIMFVGMGEVGKSTLAHAVLLDKPLPRDSQMKRTEDFELLDPTLCWKPQVKLQSGPTEVELYSWDFGGQPELHGLHEVFLGDRPGEERTVYVLVLAADKKPGVFPNAGHERGNRLAYWVNMLYHYAGPNAPVVVVITKCDPDAGPRQIDEPVQVIQRDVAELEVSAPGVVNAPEDSRTNGTMPRIEPMPKTVRMNSPSIKDDLRACGLNVVAVIDGCAATEGALEKHPEYREKLDEVREAIQAAIEAIKPTLEKTVFKELKHVKRAVEAQLRGRQPVPENGQRPPDQGHAYVDKDQFASWCDDIHDDNSQKIDIQLHEHESYLTMLDTLGALFYFGRIERESREFDIHGHEKAPHNLRQRGWIRRVRKGELDTLFTETISNPRWLKNAIYAAALGPTDSEGRRPSHPVSHVTDEELWKCVCEAIRTVRQSVAPGEEESVVKKSQAIRLVKKFLTQIAELGWIDKRTGELVLPRGYGTVSPDRPAAKLRVDLYYHFLPETAFHRLLVQCEANDGFHLQQNPNSDPLHSDFATLIEQKSKITFHVRYWPSEERLEVGFPDGTSRADGERIALEIETLMKDRRLAGETREVKAVGWEEIESQIATFPWIQLGEMISKRLPKDTQEGKMWHALWNAWVKDYPDGPEPEPEKGHKHLQRGWVKQIDFLSKLDNVGRLKANLVKLLEATLKELGMKADDIVIGAGVKNFHGQENRLILKDVCRRFGAKKPPKS